jgi:hypothetical protein
MARVVLATAEVTGVPDVAGNTWVVLQWLLGLERLGVDVVWVDRQGTLDPRSAPHGIDYAVRILGEAAHDFDFEGRWSVVYEGGRHHFGLGERELERFVDGADLLLNMAGRSPVEGAIARIPRRAFIDLDPGFTQIWARQVDMGFGDHNLFFTVGQNVTRPEFAIPTDGVPWRSILPPVVLDLWPAAGDETCTRVSSIGDWRGSQDSLFEGETYTGKRMEFIRFLDVPRLSGQRFELALLLGQGDWEDLGLLYGRDWVVLDPYEYAGDLHSYREFIQSSRAEFSVAKSGYLKSRSGWVSDRTACYLASAKPAVVQSTGVEWRLPTGRGLLTFSDVEEAVAGLAVVDKDYVGHSRAARKLAETHFSSDVVLAEVLEVAGM